MIKATSGTIIGTSHLKTGTPCQDAVARKIKSTSACIALADGAGSRPLSHIGSAILTDRMADFGLKNFEALHRLINLQSPKALDMVVDPLIFALTATARRKKLKVDAFASTLMFFVVQDNRYVAGHIGDGAIFIQDTTGVRVLSQPDNGEYSNVTYFITDKKAKTKLRLYSGIIEHHFGVMLMSDGTAESLFDKRFKKPAEAAKRLFQWSNNLPIRKMSKVLSANLEKSFRTRTTDDCSIVVMTR